MFGYKMPDVMISYLVPCQNIKDYKNSVAICLGEGKKKKLNITFFFFLKNRD